MITALVIAMAVLIGLFGGWVYAGCPLPQRAERTVGLPSRADLLAEELLQS